MEILPTSERDDLVVWFSDGERGVIVGNCHTHPGRFSVLWDNDGQTHATSLYQLSRVSEPADLWIAGFLAGQEPDPQQVFEEDVSEDMSQEQFNEWQAVNREFQTTGKQPTARLRQRFRDV